jgi:hypothetical protein
MMLDMLAKLGWVRWFCSVSGAAWDGSAILLSVLHRTFAGPARSGCALTGPAGLIRTILSKAVAPDYSRTQRLALNR